MEKKHLATNDQDWNKLKMNANIQIIHDPKRDLEEDGQYSREKIHGFSSKVGDVHGSKQCCNLRMKFDLIDSINFVISTH